MRITGFLTRFDVLPGRNPDESGLLAFNIEGVNLLCRPELAPGGNVPLGSEVTAHCSVNWKQKSGVHVPQFWINALVVRSPLSEPQSSPV